MHRICRTRTPATHRGVAKHYPNNVRPITLRRTRRRTKNVASLRSCSDIVFGNMLQCFPRAGYRTSANLGPIGPMRTKIDQPHLYPKLPACQCWAVGRSTILPSRTTTTVASSIALLLQGSSVSNSQSGFSATHKSLCCRHWLSPNVSL